MAETERTSEGIVHYLRRHAPTEGNIEWASAGDLWLRSVLDAALNPRHIAEKLRPAQRLSIYKRIVRSLRRAVKEKYRRG